MALISAMPSVLVKHLCWGLGFTVFLPPRWARTHSEVDGSYLSVVCEGWTEPASGLWEALRWGGGGRLCGWFLCGSVPELSQWAPWWRSWLQINATRAIGARLDGSVCQSCVQHSPDLIFSCFNDQHLIMASCLQVMIISYQQMCLSFYSSVENILYFENEMITRVMFTWA